MGILLFHALDYGLCDDEERSLSKPLELLIERLTSANELARRARRRQRRRRLKAKRARTDSERFDSIGTVEAEEDEEDEGDDDDDDVDDEDEDVGVNTDEGIEDCHEHEECPRGSALVNVDQVMQVRQSCHSPSFPGHRLGGRSDICATQPPEQMFPMHVSISALALLVRVQFNYSAMHLRRCLGLPVVVVVVVIVLRHQD